MPSTTSFSMTHLPRPMNLDDVLNEIRNTLLLHPAWRGAIKVVVELETGEQLTVLDIGARCPPPTTPAPSPRHRPVPHTAAATASARADDVPVDEHAAIGGQPNTQQDLLQRCNQQQERIAELEKRLQQVQHKLDQHAQSRSPSPAAPCAERRIVSLAPRTDDDSSSGSSVNDSPHRSSGSDTDEDVREHHQDVVAMTDDAADASASPNPPASNDSSAVRKSERSKINVERWSPSIQQDRPRRVVEAAAPHKKRRTGRHQRSHDDDDGERSIGSDMMSVEVESMDGQVADDDDDAVEVAALVTKLREGYDKRQTVAIDSLSKESILALRQQVLDEAGDRIAAISSQITSLISTSTSLRMVGYFLRAILAHRLKFNAQNSYKRVARDTLGVKSPADIAAYPALYELVQHHYPTLASAGIEAWLENPIFTADITWTEWKRYLSKQGRLIIDAALQQFKASVASYQDWMELGWVEIYADEKLGGQGVRALRDIHMPRSKTKQAQRDVMASISVVAADLHCAGPECVLDKDSAADADPTYHLQLDRQRVFDARDHWIGKINHLPDRLCNIRLTSSGKLMQIKPIVAGEALTFDYDVDYWVYRLSGLELSDWCAGSSVASSRGAVDMFRQMHERMCDYTDLLSREWVRHRPAVWTELNRECWMADLAEYLEHLRL